MKLHLTMLALAALQLGGCTTDRADVVKADDKADQESIEANNKADVKAEKAQAEADVKADAAYAKADDKAVEAQRDADVAAAKADEKADKVDQKAANKAADVERSGYIDAMNKRLKAREADIKSLEKQKKDGGMANVDINGLKQAQHEAEHRLKLIKDARAYAWQNLRADSDKAFANLDNLVADAQRTAH